MLKDKIAKSWTELTVDQYQELNLIPSDLSFFEKQKELLYILSDYQICEEDVEEMDINDFNELSKNIKWLSIQPQQPYERVINGYTLINIQQMNLNDYIDIQDLMTLGLIENLHIIFAILYRKTKLDDFGNTIFEKSGSYDIYGRAEEFKKVCIVDVFKLIDEYIAFKDMVYNNYMAHFNQVFEDEEDLSTITDEKMRYEIEQEIEQEKIDAKFSWHRLVHKLANGVISEYEYILQQPVTFIFNELTMRKRYNL